jgi:hypothetical protein
MPTSPQADNHQPESRMREIRTSGSEGGAAQTNAPSLPLRRVIAPGSRATLTVFHWIPTRRPEAGEGTRP